jgi:transcriptional regulator with XRE-family HTH domain
MDAEWKQRVRDALDEMDWEQKDLADALGCSGGAITNLLKPSQPGSRLVDDICRILHIPPPGFVDTYEAEIYEMMKVLRRENPRAWDKYAEGIRRHLAHLKDNEKPDGE